MNIERGLTVLLRKQKRCSFFTPYQEQLGVACFQVDVPTSGRRDNALIQVATRRLYGK